MSAREWGSEELDAALDQEEANELVWSDRAAETDQTVSGRAGPDSDPAVHGPGGYLSTACLHRDHTYCSAMTGYQGAKRPARCKFCATPCVCPCHAAPTTPAGGTQ